MVHGRDLGMDVHGRDGCVHGRNGCVHGTIGMDVHGRDGAQPQDPVFLDTGRNSLFVSTFVGRGDVEEYLWRRRVCPAQRTLTVKQEITPAPGASWVIVAASSAQRRQWTKLTQ